eukprot:1286229-Prymnesium_polylepis.1
MELSSSAESHPQQTHSLPNQPIDILIFVCSPASAPLAAACVEAKQVAECFHRCQRISFVQYGGDLLQMLSLLDRLDPVMLLFIGHANARHDEGALTLGLTGRGNDLIRMLPETIIDVIGQSSRRRLKLVVLNGCKSEQM